MLAEPAWPSDQLRARRASGHCGSRQAATADFAGSGCGSEVAGARKETEHEPTDNHLGPRARGQRAGGPGSSEPIRQREHHAC
jgi:hypothetical protein